MPTPLRPSTATGQGPQTPEALLISALLKEGTFDLERHRIDREDFEAYQPLVRFCAEHQEHAGRAPAMEVVARKFPEFEFTDNVNLRWAVNQMQKEVGSRGLRTRIKEALDLLNDDAVDDAYTAFDDLKPPTHGAKQGLDGLDFVATDSDFDAPKIPVPWDTLGRATGGIALGDLWYISARTGHGKTNIASCYAARAILAGYRVAVWSLEIPAAAWATRVRRAAAAMLMADSKMAIRKDLLADIDSQDRATVKLALDDLREHIHGGLTLYDPSHGRCTAEAVRDSQEDKDLVIVDHVGLMVTRDGKRAIDDWRIMSTISNRLKEETLRNETPILGLAQINRQGDAGNNRMRTPKISEISQSDAIGQDGDVVITMNRYSKSVMLHDGAKVRNGPSIKWFSQFDPKNASYNEIRRERADNLAMNDDDEEIRQVGEM